MRYLQLVGHDLVCMLAVCFAQMFVQHDAMTNGQNGIDTIKSEEDDIGEVVFDHHELTHRKDEDEGNADGTHITRKTFSLFAKVEETKHKIKEILDYEHSY